MGDLGSIPSGPGDCQRPITSPGSPIEVGTGFSNAGDAWQAGTEAARDALAAIRVHPISVLFVFASAHYDLEAALRGIHSIVGNAPVLGATTAGEICDHTHRQSIVVLALASPELDVRCAVGYEVSRNWRSAIDQITATSDIAAYFSAGAEPWLRLACEGKAAFAVLFCPGNTRLSDARCYEMLEAIKLKSLGRLPVLVGAAGDNWRMEQNYVLLGRQALADCALLAVFETKLQFGIGLAHGFRPTAARTTVTAIEDHEVLALDGEPASLVFARLLGVSSAELDGKHLTLATGHPFGTADPMGQFSVNAPSYTTARGGIRFTQPVSIGTVLTLMEPDGDLMSRAGPDSVRKGILRGGITEPAAVLASYCALRPRLLGEADAEREICAMSDLAKGAPVAGFHSFGEGGVADDGVSRFSNAAVAALVLGRALSPAAQAAHENERLREELSLHARLLEQRVDERTNELKRRDAVLSAIAQSATDLLGSSELERTLGRVVELLGQAVDADAVWVLKHAADHDGHAVASLINEWTTPGIPSHLGDPTFQNIELETLGLDRLERAVHQDVPVCVTRDNATGIVCHTLDSIDVRSLLLVPVFVGTEWWGLVGLVHSRMERSWTSLEMDAMRMLAATVGNAIERKAAEERIAVLARTDSLTGLANRATFEQRLNDAFAAMRHDATPFAVHYVDLDFFKSINDRLGHAVGDALLKAVAARLAANIREMDLAARLGGDEFAILQMNVTDPSAATMLAERILSAFRLPYVIQGGELCIGASIGIISCTPETQGPEELLAQADRALYRAKAEGRAQYRFSSDEISKAARARL